jgi:hypothetical protein
VIVVFLPGALVACSGGGSTPAAEEIAGSEDRFLQQVNEVREYAWIMEFLADQMVPECMKAEGFEYWALPLADGEVPELDDDPLDPESDEIEPPNSAVAHNLEYFDGLDDPTRDAYSDALLGTSGPRLTLEHSSGAVTSYPASGCLGEARLSLLGEDDYLIVEGSMAELEGLAFEIDDRAYASDGYQEGTDALQSCLREQGFDLPELSMDIEGSLDPDLETTATEAVLGCGEQLDLASRFQELEDRAAYELFQDPRVEAALQTWSERRDAITRRLDASKEELLGP